MSIETDAAQAGATVLYLAGHMDEVPPIIDAEIASRPDEISSVQRTHGRQRINYRSGGRIIFTATSISGGRGISAAFISVSARDSKNPAVMATILPCTFTHSDARMMIRL